MTTRTLTKEQFSDNTTIDGNRLEKALEDTRERFNKLQAKDIDYWVENRFNSGFTPRVRTGVTDADNQHYEGPFIWNFKGTIPADLDNIEPNNAFRYKGCGTLNAATGQVVDNGTDNDLGWLWTSTKHFSVPTIINDVTMFGIFDDKMVVGGTLATEAWFWNSWQSSGDYAEDFHLWICVDNPLNTGDTFQRNSEVHLWTISAKSLLMNNYENVQSYTLSGENVAYNPALGASEQRVNALACRLTDLNIPVFAGSRVRFVFGIPGERVQADDTWSSGIATGLGYSNTSDVYTNPKASFANNIWSFNMSVLQPLERNK